MRLDLPNTVVPTARRGGGWLSLHLGRGRASRGFTVLELMLSISIMTVIVIGLYTVFNQTQRALRSTMSQVDVLEGVRATSDLLVRDVEAATPLAFPNTNLTAMAAWTAFGSAPMALQGLAKNARPVLVTQLQDIYLVKRQNDFWSGVGYWVGPIDTNQIGQPFHLGRLYRFEYETNSAAFAHTNLYLRFADARDPLKRTRLHTSQAVMDGVVHLRLIAYDAQGYPLVYDERDRPPYQRVMAAESLADPRSWLIDTVRSDATAYDFRRFTHPRFPASVELEIGVVEGPVMTRYLAIPAPAEARKYLERNAGRVHLFRHRIPLRNAPNS